jgi:hypothetical protein
MAVLPPSSAGGGGPRSPVPPQGRELIARLDAATADLSKIDLVDLEGDAAPPARAEAPPPAAPPKPPPPTPSPSEGAEAAALSARSGADDLELDFAAAGVEAFKGQSSAVAPTSPGPLVPASVSPPARRSSPSPVAERRGLLAADRPTAFLLAGAIGLLVGLYPALEASRRLLVDRSDEPLTELVDAVDRPLAVRAGELRSPAVIAGEIEASYDAARGRFWVVWLSIAVPVTLVLGSLRRPS